MNLSKYMLSMAIFSVVACQQSDYRDVQQYTIEQFLNTESIGGSSFSADEQYILFSSNKTGIYNAYTIPVGGGESTALTSSEDNAIFALSFFPNDSRILFSSDQGGNEISHIFLREEDGSVRDLTPDKEARAEFYGWSFDGKSFFFGSNKRNPRFMDVYEMDIQTFSSALIFLNDAGFNLNSISRDKRYLVFSETITTHNSNLHLFDRESGQIQLMTPHQGDIQYQAQTFSPDSKTLYFLTDEDREFTYLKRYDLASGRSDVEEQTDWDIAFATFSRNGMYRVLGVNADGQTSIRITETATGQPVKLPDLPGGNVSSVAISKSEKRMAFYHNGSRSPNNLYVYHLDPKQTVKLTDTMNPQIDPDDLVEARVVRYSSFDGLDIPAIYYKPRHIKPGQKAPALVMVHGGPGGQARIGYNPVVQYLANHGYVVIDVNNRGSSGYGKTFFKLDDRKHGEDDLMDCLFAKQFLASTGVVDSNRIGIIGGSYGGYMVLAALTLQPEAFAAGVDLFGISNWVRTLESIPPWWESYREALYLEMGNPETDREYLYRISPLFHADKIVRPLMVLQGANDPRVLQVESDEIVEAARKNGVPTEYVVFEDEGHGFVKKVNQIRGYKAVLTFLEHYLKNR